MKWNYLTLDVLGHPDGKHVEYRAVGTGLTLTLPAGNAFYAQVGKTLSLIGEEGWELMAGLGVPPAAHASEGLPVIKRYVFKREKKS